MKKLVYKFSLICGLLLTLAAFSVFAQNSEIQDGKFNKVPLKSSLYYFGIEVLKKSESKKNDLTKPFLVEAEGSINNEGKLDKNVLKFTKTEGDSELVELAKQGIEAVSKGGWLKYLSSLEIDKIQFSFGQDEKQTFVKMKTELPSISKVQTLKSAFNLIISLNKDKRKGRVEETLLNGISISSVRNMLEINFSIPKETFLYLVQNELSKIPTDEWKVYNQTKNDPINYPNPIKHFASSKKFDLTNKSVDFNKPFKLSLEVVHSKTNENSSLNYLEKIGDEDIKEIAKSGINHLLKMNALFYYSDHFIVTLSQDSENLLASINTETESEEQAEYYLNDFVKNDIGSEKVSKNELEKMFDAESILYFENQKISAKREGRNFIINISFPKQYVQDIIKKELGISK